MNLKALFRNKKTTGQSMALASIMLGAVVTLTACNNAEHEAKAVDKVDEAAELAQAKAPAPEPLAVEDMAVVETDTEAAKPEEGAAEGMETEAAATPATEEASPTPAADTAVIKETPAAQDSATPETVDNK